MYIIVDKKKILKAKYMKVIINGILYGKLGFPRFGKRLKDEDYDVLINGLMNGFSIKNIDNFIILYVCFFGTF